MKKQNKNSKKRPQSKCPHNITINCVAGFFCEGCSHEFDNVTEEIKIN